MCYGLFIAIVFMINRNKLKWPKKTTCCCWAAFSHPHPPSSGRTRSLSMTCSSLRHNKWRRCRSGWGFLQAGGRWRWRKTRLWGGRGKRQWQAGRSSGRRRIQRPAPWGCGGWWSSWMWRSYGWICLNRPSPSHWPPRGRTARPCLC